MTTFLKGEVTCWSPGMTDMRKSEKRSFILGQRWVCILVYLVQTWVEMVHRKLGFRTEARK